MRAWQGGGGAYVAGETATAAGGTHPSGMRLRHTFCLMLSSHIRTSGQTNVGKLSSQKWSIWISAEWLLSYLEGGSLGDASLWSRRSLSGGGASSSPSDL